MLTSHNVKEKQNKLCEKKIEGHFWIVFLYVILVLILRVNTLESGSVVRCNLFKFYGIQ